MTSEFDIIIIGAGPAGLTSAVYSARSCLKTCVIEKASPGGMALIIDNLENYPGFPEGIHGYEIAVKLETQAKKFGAEIVSDEVLNISGKPGAFMVQSVAKEYKAKAIIIASGSRYQKLKVPGEEELIGKGVSYCATCDGAFFKNQKVAVIGGGNSALQEAMYLSRLAAEVYLIHRRDAYRASKILQKVITANKKVKPVLNSVVTAINGKDRLESVTVKNVISGQISSLILEGIFVAIGHVPNTAFCKKILKQDAVGYIIVDENMQTSIPGIFSAGDCRVTALRQVATAVGDGAFAAEHADRFLQELV